MIVRNILFVTSLLLVGSSVIASDWSWRNQKIDSQWSSHLSMKNTHQIKSNSTTFRSPSSFGFTDGDSFEHEQAFKSCMQEYGRSPDIFRLSDARKLCYSHKNDHRKEIYAKCFYDKPSQLTYEENRYFCTHDLLTKSELKQFRECLYKGESIRSCEAKTSKTFYDFVQLRVIKHKRAAQLAKYTIRYAIDHLDSQQFAVLNPILLRFKENVTTENMASMKFYFINDDNVFMSWLGEFKKLDKPVMVDGDAIKSIVCDYYGLHLLTQRGYVYDYFENTLPTSSLFDPTTHWRFTGYVTSKIFARNGSNLRIFTHMRDEDGNFSGYKISIVTYQKPNSKGSSKDAPCDSYLYDTGVEHVTNISINKRGETVVEFEDGKVVPYKSLHLPTHPHFLNKYSAYNLF